MDSVLLLAVLFLAGTNGANDNFKGVATLYGSRRAGYWTSLLWAGAATLAGSLCSVFLAHALLKAFTGAGLVPSAIATQPRFAFAVAGGGAVTVALAAWRGLPISTTHALIGAMGGAGLVAVGSTMRFAVLGTTFLLPLLASPVIAMAPAFLLSPLLRRLVARAAAEPECVCTQSATIVTPEGVMMRGTMPVRVTGTKAECRAAGARPAWRLDARGAVDALLFLRGLNDTPKIAALLLPVTALGGHGTLAVALVGAAMLAGGLLGARRVARTMSDKITQLDIGAALAAGVTTSLLVGTASFNGLPVSTTHVSVGALVGTGLNGGGGVDRQVMTNIVLSWIVTLPMGALVGAILYALVR
jgi:inorganic phosphate transporter, PiT family